ncbi:hypothetical protein SAMN05216299_10375 [Nitrosospira sp. Nsp14]|nr:hypothetical protein SAMN05216299_10375 [Nitrosospira sp. Nsp14]
MKAVLFVGLWHIFGTLLRKSLLGFDLLPRVKMALGTAISTSVLRVTQPLASARPSDLPSSKIRNSHTHFLVYLCTVANIVDFHKIVSFPVKQAIQ